VIFEEVGRIAHLFAHQPAKGIERIGRGLGIVRARMVLRGCECGKLVYVHGDLRVENHGRIEIGDRVQFVGGMLATEIRCAAGGELFIGAESLVNYGVSIRASHHVRIGKRCLIASMVHIRDRDRTRNEPVIIGDDVWIAHGATIEPGVTIGAGSAISAGSVVVSDVPPHSIAVGNPATCMPIGIMRGRQA
jgi:maltose O-acetyltransferase